MDGWTDGWMDGWMYGWMVDSSDLTACSRQEVEILRWRFCKYSLFDVITLVMGKTNI